jgi:GWxTD domain-containing protein
MTLLNNFVNNSWAAAVGWTLLHSLWEAAVVAALLALAFFATQSPRIRYIAGCMALSAILTAFVITLFRMSPQQGQLLGNVNSLPFPAWNGALRSAPRSWDLSLAAAAPWLTPLWAFGVLIFYVRYAIGFLTIARLRSNGVCCPPAAWEQRLLSLSKQMRVSRAVRILESSLAEAPIVIGHFRPLILMPIGLLTGLPGSQVETILLHELAHIRRHDFLVNALQNFVDGLLFYNPAIWWISHVIRAEREKCCDDIVVGISGNAHEYACALAALEEIRWSGREPAVAAKGGSLMKRVRRLLYPSVPNVGWAPIVATAVLLMAAVTTLGAWQANGVATVTSDSYSKWVSEDVVYIIDDAEWAAFQKLTTDEEREHFVEQFWERRNPVPGSAENKFKEEHYRRIAFANKHFATGSGAPGWQTDRGHMYVLYGPPDEIDSHPKGTPHPWESWGYRVLGSGSSLGYFRFVDLRGTGDFRLAPSTDR